MLVSACVLPAPIKYRHMAIDGFSKRSESPQQVFLCQCAGHTLGEKEVALQPDYGHKRPGQNSSFWISDLVMTDYHSLYLANYYPER